MSSYDWATGPTFNYDRDEVMEYCSALSTIEQELGYLAFVLKERRNNPPELDCNIGRSPDFESFIQNEIEYKELLRGLSSEFSSDIVKITGKVSSIVRILEAMKYSEIISLNTEASQIGRMFFSEKIDVLSFASKYNARKKDLVEDERRTSNEALVKFVIQLIEMSFKGKIEILDRISDHVERIRKNSIY